MQKKGKIWLIAGLILAAAICIYGWQMVRNTYVSINGKMYRRDAQSVALTDVPLENPEKVLRFYDLKQLDLRGSGTSAADYEWLRANLPGCSISWDLPFQGECRSLDTKELTLTTLSDDEVALLDYLPELTRVDASGCSDIPQLQALEARHPGCRVLYSVALGEASASNDSRELQLSDADAAALMTQLGQFPELEKVHLTGSLPGRAELEKLEKQYPQVVFSWDVPIMGQTFASDELALDLTRSSMKYEEYADLLSYFPKLEYVNLKGTALGQEDMMKLCRKYPDCFFLWEMDFLGQKVSTDAEEIDISGTKLSSTEEVEALLPMLPGLKQLVMCESGLENEDIEAMNKRHPDTKIVFDVKLGQKMFRTDITSFMPVKYGFNAGDYSLGNLKYCHDMECIDLGHQAVYSIEWAREMPNLRFVLLGDTHVSDISPLENHKKLVYLELFLLPLKDTTPLLSCTALEDLNLSYTEADVEPVARMTWLKRVWWSGWLPARQILPEALPDAHLECYSSSSTGKGWREGKLYYEQRDILGMRYMTG